MSEIVYVNETSVDQIVYTPWRMPLTVKPGECVAGDWFKRFSVVGGRSLTPREGYHKQPIKVIDDPAAGMIAQLLDADPTLEEKTQAVRRGRHRLTPKS